LAGTLQLENASGSIVGDVTNNSTLAFDPKRCHGRRLRQRTDGRLLDRRQLHRALHADPVLNPGGGFPTSPLNGC
jgi:hypothetical protein